MSGWMYGWMEGIKERNLDRLMIDKQVNKHKETRMSNL